MKKTLYPAFAYLRYWLIKEDRYAVQPPFLAGLYQNLLNYLKTSKDKDIAIEAIRKRLLADSQILEISDFGAGSKKLSSSFRKTCDVTRYSTTGRKFSQIYQFLCQQTPAQQVLELGTCVGLNTHYLAYATKGHLYTFEGAKALWEKAQSYQKAPHTTYVQGQIAHTLPPLLEKIKHVDFVLIDATHTFQGSIEHIDMLWPYMQDNSIMVLADIHWSPEMSKAWEVVRVKPQITLSIDFFECGVLFFKKGLTKDNYVLAI